MPTYPIMDPHLNVIGSMHVYDEGWKDLLMDGHMTRYGMSGIYTEKDDEKKFMAVLVFPIEAKEK